jgi:predicted MPP superfamily phosphohydrolase
MRWYAVPAGLGGLGVAVLGYASLYERNQWTLRRFDVPVLPPSQESLTVLHLSDIHMLARQRGKRHWLRALAALEPDLVVNTGDNLAGHDAVPAVVAALGPLLDRPGAFVMGSNDYYAPKPKNPLRYLFPDEKRIVGERLPWRELRDIMTGRGWVDLSNRRGELKAAGLRIALAGLDDPHLHRDRYDEIAGPAPADADLRLGLLHSPEPWLLHRFATDGYDLVVAGHTHGGQLRVPFYGAPVTNCGLDRARSRWLSRWTDAMWLHVSAGLGTSPYAPYRFACRPEATLLTLTARD